jgi:hypothetical protein
MLEGTWRSDLERALLQHFGSQRRGFLGKSTLSKCPASHLAGELASLYTKPPKVHHVAGLDLSVLFGAEGVVSRAGLWPKARRFQKGVLLQREGLRRIDVIENRLVYRTVYPDTVEAHATDADPENPVLIRELRWRYVPTLGPRWTWDVLSIEDPERPFYRVQVHGEQGRPGLDVTEQVLGRSLEGDAYPYRWTQGERAGAPFLPYVVYHAERAGRLWSPNEWIEIVEASLDLACMWTFFGHTVFRASWPQRWGLDVEVAGSNVREDEHGTARSDVPADPSTMVHLTASMNAKNAQVGQWSPASSPLELQQAIGAYERSVITIAGVEAANIVRESSDAWSGAALSISREGKREAQNVYEESFRPSDDELLEKTGALLNLSRIMRYRIPESGYRVEYQKLPLSPMELRNMREHHNEQIDRGRMSPSEALMIERPGMTQGEARRAIEENVREVADLEVLRELALREARARAGLVDPPSPTPGGNPGNNPAGSGFPPPASP